MPYLNNLWDTLILPPTLPCVTQGNLRNNRRLRQRIDPRTETINEDGGQQRNKDNESNLNKQDYRSRKIQNGTTVYNRVATRGRYIH